MKQFYIQPIVLPLAHQLRLLLYVIPVKGKWMLRFRIISLVRRPGIQLCIRSRRKAGVVAMGIILINRATRSYKGSKVLLILPEANVFHHSK